MEERKHVTLFKDMSETKAHHDQFDKGPSIIKRWLMKGSGLILGFILPPVGIALFVLWRDDYRAIARYPLAGFLLSFSWVFLIAFIALRALIIEIF